MLITGKEPTKDNMQKKLLSVSKKKEKKIKEKNNTKFTVKCTI